MLLDLLAILVGVPGAAWSISKPIDRYRTR